MFQTTNQLTIMKPHYPVHSLGALGKAHLQVGRSLDSVRAHGMRTQKGPDVVGPGMGKKGDCHGLVGFLMVC